MKTYDNNASSSLPHLRSVLSEQMQFQYAADNKSQEINISEIVDIIVHEFADFSIRLDSVVIDQVLGRIENKLAARGLQDAYLSEESLNNINDCLTYANELTSDENITLIDAIVQVLGSINISSRIEQLKSNLFADNEQQDIKSKDKKKSDGSDKVNTLMKGLKGLSTNDINDILFSMTFFDDMLIAFQKEITKQVKPLLKMHLALKASTIALNVAQVDLLRSTLTLKATTFALAMANLKLSLANIAYVGSKILLVTSKIALALAGIALFVANMMLAASRAALAVASVTLMMSWVSGMLMLTFSMLLSLTTITASMLLSLAIATLGAAFTAATVFLSFAAFVSVSILALGALTIAAVLGIAAIVLVSTLALGALLMATIAIGGTLAIAIGVMLIAAAIVATALTLLTAALFGGILIATVALFGAMNVVAAVTAAAAILAIAIASTATIVVISAMFLAAIAAVTAAAALVEIALLAGIIIMLGALYYFSSQAFEAVMEWWKKSPLKDLIDKLKNWWEQLPIKRWLQAFLDELHQAGGFKEYIQKLINDFLTTDPIGKEIQSIFGNFTGIHSISDIWRKFNARYSFTQNVTSVFNRLVDTIPGMVLTALKKHFDAKREAVNAEQLKAENPDASIEQASPASDSGKTEMQMPSGRNVVLDDAEMASIDAVETSKQKHIDDSNAQIHADIAAAQAKDDADHDNMLQKTNNETQQMEALSMQLDALDATTQSAGFAGAMSGSMLGSAAGRNNRNDVNMEK